MGDPLRQGDAGRWPRWLGALTLFAYVLWFRTHDITQSFGLGGDQMRDWQVALRPLTSLPLSGVSSTAGGNTIGPIYYWILWSIARVIGPFVDYLLVGTTHGV